MTRRAGQSVLLDIAFPDFPDAACRGVDPEAFWAPGDYTIDPLAQATCAICPARRRCLDYAIDNRQEHGTWGGMTPYQRRVEARLRAGVGRRGCPRCGARQRCVDDETCEEARMKRVLDE